MGEELQETVGMVKATYESLLWLWLRRMVAVGDGLGKWCLNVGLVSSSGIEGRREPRIGAEELLGNIL